MNALSHAAHSRHLLKSVLGQRLSQRHHKILKELLHGHNFPHAPTMATGWLTDSGGGATAMMHRNTFMPQTNQNPLGGLDQKKLEFAIDQLVASALVHGQQTSSVLRILFGLVPSLIGR